MQNYNSKFKMTRSVILNSFQDLRGMPKPASPAGRRVRHDKKLFGFTLIELLVVIAIMAMVMAVFFPNFMGARQRARDAQRKSDLSQIQKSLEMYKLDQNPQSYPTSGGLATCGVCFTSGGLTATCAPDKNIYMRKIPCDTGSTLLTPYIYKRDTLDSLKYTLTACLENAVDADKDITPDSACTSSTNVSYTVREP